MHPAQPPPRPTPPGSAGSAGSGGVAPAGAEVGGFHTIAEALRGAAREIETARDDAKKIHLPPPPGTSVVGDARAAEELDTSITLHTNTARWAIAEMAATVTELRGTAEGYTDTEDHNAHHLTDPGPGPHPGAQHPGAPHSGAQHPGAQHPAPSPAAEVRHNLNHHPAGQNETGQNETGPGGAATPAEWQPLTRRDPHSDREV
ncbi:MAG TPA: hypothetical protein VE196_07760 [Pseudonocardiaceae bacterium]|nr:hypothetical protein [Pseudonocardiaceae bacterium]